MGEELKGPGRGRGKFTEAGAQAAQAQDIEALKSSFAVVVEAGAALSDRVDALEAKVGGGEPVEPEQPPEPPPA